MLQRFVSALLWGVYRFSVLPLALLRLAYKCLYHSAYRKRLGERLGRLPPRIVVAAPMDIWFHTVSVGEFIAALPLIEACLIRWPGIQILITTMTATGSERVRSVLGDRVEHCYLPYDMSACVNHFLKRVRPRLCVILETELWPNYLRLLHHRKIPVLLVNARLSDRSYRGYLKIRPIVKDILGYLTRILVQTLIEADRFLKLGAVPAQISVSGNIKFDLKLPTDLVSKGDFYRACFGKDRLVWLVASSHAPEESLILQAFQSVQKKIPHILLCWVPRHPDRFAAVGERCKAAGLSVCLGSSERAVAASESVFVLDRMGALLYAYAACDVAFVAGSFAPIGGHNPLEPAALGIPVIVGPHVFNFEWITALLREAGALVQVSDVSSLVEAVCDLLEAPDRRQQMGDTGRAVVLAHQGVVGRVMDEIAALR
jgi:3-deoxy-D-manno-octulosonic-acid transferase